MEHSPGAGFKQHPSDRFTDGEWAQVLRYWEKVGATDTPGDLEKPLGAIADRLLMSKGYRSVDAPSREMLLAAIWQALRDAFESRKRNSQGDYAPDLKAERFEERCERRCLVRCGANRHIQ